MKHCPQCNRVESDEALKFCRVDGAPLTDSPSVNREAATVQLELSAPNETHPSPLPHETRATADSHAPLTTILSSQHSAGTVREITQLKRRRTAILIAVIAIAVIAVITASLVNRYRSKATGAAIQSIAVMPFINGSGDSQVEYLSDGLTDSLIFRFSQLPNLKVSPTSSVMRFKNTAKDVAEVARELDVDAVLSG